MGLFSVGSGSLALYAIGFSVTVVTICTVWAFSSDVTNVELCTGKWGFTGSKGGGQADRHCLFLAMASLKKQCPLSNQIKS